MPSYFGSKVQPSPGISLPTLAYIGSSEVAGSFSGALAAATVFFTPDIAEGKRLADFRALGSRLLFQTRLFPEAISSIVRPLSTEVMLSATTSSSVAYSSRCLMRSHWGFDELDRSRANFMRTSAKDP